MIIRNLASNRKPLDSARGDGQAERSRGHFTLKTDSFFHQKVSYLQDCGYSIIILTSENFNINNLMSFS